MHACIRANIPTHSDVFSKCISGNRHWAFGRNRHSLGVVRSHISLASKNIEGGSNNLRGPLAGPYRRQLVGVYLQSKYQKQRTSFWKLNGQPLASGLWAFSRGLAVVQRGV